MKAAVAYAPRDIRLAEVPRPEPGRGEVRLDVQAVGICGSDIHLCRIGGATTAVLTCGCWVCISTAGWPSQWSCWRRGFSQCQPFSIGMQAVTRGAINQHDRVVVLGAGPIGLTILVIAKSRGAQVAIVDLLDSRLVLAKRLGADLAINGASSDPTAGVTD